MKQASGGFNLGSFCLAGHLSVDEFRHAFVKGTDGPAPSHAAPVMGAPSVVVLEVWIKHGQLMRDTGGIVAGMGEGAVKDRSLNLGRHAVRVGSIGPGKAVDRGIRAIGPEVPPDFIEWLPGIAGSPCRRGSHSEIRWRVRATTACVVLPFLAWSSSWFFVLEFCVAAPKNSLPTARQPRTRRADTYDPRA